MEIKYHVGDATEPVGDGQKVIVHCCNDQGGWGSGFVVALSKRWSHVEASYRHWYALRYGKKEDVARYKKRMWNRSYSTSGSFDLGQIQCVLADVFEDIFVINLIGQHKTGINKIAGISIPPVDYRSVREGFARIKKLYDEADKPFSLHMPRMCCGLAGGEWSSVHGILVEVFNTTDINIHVYDFAPGAYHLRADASIDFCSEKDNILIMALPHHMDGKGDFPEKVVYKGGLFEFMYDLPREARYYDTRNRGHYRLLQDFTGDREKGKIR